LSNDSVILVDPESLIFIENPDIASILQTSQEYCEKIEPSQLEHILSPQSLSPLQEEMMSHHCRLHHTPFPKLITMAENGEIPKRLAALKVVVQSVWRACLVKLTSAHGDPNPSRSIQFASRLMMRQGRRHRLIRWYLLNLD
jgi:hypothetical protein